MAKTAEIIILVFIAITAFYGIASLLRDAWTFGVLVAALPLASLAFKLGSLK